MKQMKYINERLIPPRVLDSGFYRGYEYYILSLGLHPTAYVVLNNENIYFGKKYDEINISCHGGITYSEKDLNPFVKDKWVIGWDYAHGNDYSGAFEGTEFINEKLKKWTTHEIYKEVKYVIHQIIIRNRK